MIWLVLGCILGAFIGAIIIGSLFIAAIQYGIGRSLGW
jgi:hypothetical protein